MKKLLIGILLLILTVSCGSKPETVVSKFIDNVKEKLGVLHASSKNFILEIQ